MKQQWLYTIDPVRIQQSNSQVEAVKNTQDLKTVQVVWKVRLPVVIEPVYHAKVNLAESASTKFGPEKN